MKDIFLREVFVQEDLNLHHVVSTAGLVRCHLLHLSYGSLGMLFEYLLSWKMSYCSSLNDYLKNKYNGSNGHIVEVVYYTS